MRELALVMPVYNEEACIAQVVQDWLDELNRIGIDFVMIILNDGSTDGTKGILTQFSRNGRIILINKENSGHGPTLLMGYGIAVKESEWVFQTDSDGEMSPDHFSKLWEKRKNFDALFGYRQGREQCLGRRIISKISRITVRVLFGRGVVDVNTPYRLMRTSILSCLLSRIPADTFAPNVIVSGEFVRMGMRISDHPVPHEGRRTGTASIVRWKLWNAAARSFIQSVKFRISAPPDCEVRRK